VPQLSFDDCAVEFGRGTRCFEVELLKPTGPFADRHRFVGSYGFDGDLVATAITLPQQDPAAVPDTAHGVVSRPPSIC
jgi:hypothetical protein